VHVLVLAARNLSVRELGETLLDLHELGIREQPRCVQPSRMNVRCAAVIWEQLSVVRAQELLDLRRERRADSARPERHSGV
jgi:hypothetical protein